MKQISVCKAQGVGERKATSVQITISEEIPSIRNCKNWRIISEKEYEQEAEKLFNGLKECLPQGTMHQLLICMLRDKQNLMVGI